MGEIVNLRQVRKTRSRDEKQRLADENRLKHGRSKQDKVRVAGEQQRQDRHLNGHRRVEPGQDPVEE